MGFNLDEIPEQTELELRRRLRASGILHIESNLYECLHSAVARVGDNSADWLRSAATARDAALAWIAAMKAAAIEIASGEIDPHDDAIWPPFPVGHEDIFEVVNDPYLF